MNPRIYGIRHNGPGSARSLLKALKEDPPDLLLVEGPSDATSLLEHLKEEDLQAPVAMLLYNPKQLKQAAYFPFADFSPEWQAIRFAQSQNIPVQFMDLPHGIQFALDEAEKEQTQLSALPAAKDASALNEEQKQLYADPLKYLAKLAGYEDSERWWEVTFEEQATDGRIFPAITDLMKVLRTDLEAWLPRRELLREAHMRKTIRDAVKKGFTQIAVVCGAWHAPALNDWKNYKASADNKLLRGLKKIKPATTWIPWTYDRLALQSGYRAGVTSPAWYQLLFRHPEEVVIRWMTAVAQLFRAEDIDASSAHVIEAVRLANALAMMRERALPGIQELEEAAISVLCEGHAEKMELIQSRLIIGHRIGTVPESIPQVPLQKDLEKRIKSVRLGKHWRQTGKVNKELDLRKSTQAAASQLLHRMNLLNIPWGQTRKVAKGSMSGAFQESWKLKWLPDFALLIIEAGMWGNTVESAAVNKVQQKINLTNDLPALTALIEATFHAQLDAVFAPLIARLEDVSVLTEDVTQLLDAMPALVNAYRYGSTRGINLDALLTLIEQLIPRICIALPNTCVGMDEEVSRDLLDKILAFNRAIGLFNDPQYTQDWQTTLMALSEVRIRNALLRGASTRMLFDRNQYQLEETSNNMHYALSQSNEAANAALWLEGFLHGSGQLLIHHPGLWRILDEWIADLGHARFQQLLPLLRRTFANFSQPERRKMMELAQQKEIALTSTDQVTVLHAERARKVLPTLHLILGIGN